MKVSKYFKRSEFACKCGCGFDAVDIELLGVLDNVREYFGLPLTISGPNRCENHNKAEGGSPNSQHIKGKAADIQVKGIEANQVADYLEKKYPDKYGIGRYTEWTHIDIRPNKARWDKRS